MIIGDAYETGELCWRLLARCASTLPETVHVGNACRGPSIDIIIDSTRNSRYTRDMPNARKQTPKRDDSKYGYAVRLPLNDRERDALRMLAAQRNESQGVVIAEILRRALEQSGWLKPSQK
jgi:hypothetical protein